MGMKLKCFVLIGFSFLIKMKNPVKTDFIHLCFENVTVKYFAFHETMQTVFHKSFFPQIHWLYLLTPNHILLLWWIWCYFLSWFFSVLQSTVYPLSCWDPSQSTIPFVGLEMEDGEKKDKKDRVSVALPTTFVLSFRLCGDSLFSI